MKKENRIRCSNTLESSQDVYTLLICDLKEKISTHFYVVKICTLFKQDILGTAHQFSLRKFNLNKGFTWACFQEVEMAPKGVHAAKNSVGMEIFVKMANELDTEGRYLFLNALANQLRYPNNHTHYFSCILLDLFHKAKQVLHSFKSLCYVLSSPKQRSNLFFHRSLFALYLSSWISIDVAWYILSKLCPQLILR